MQESFSSFMRESLRRARKIDDLGEPNIFEILIRIIVPIGWQGFLILCMVLITSSFLFAATLAGFLATPIGLVIVAVVGISAAESMKQLYRKRYIPLAIRSVGKKIRQKYENLRDLHDTSGIDSLCDECAREIVGEARRQLFRSCKNAYWG